MLYAEILCGSQLRQFFRRGKFIRDLQRALLECFPGCSGPSGEDIRECDIGVYVGLVDGDFGAPAADLVFTIYAGGISDQKMSEVRGRLFAARLKDLFLGVSGREVGNANTLVQVVPLSPFASSVRGTVVWQVEIPG